MAATTFNVSNTDELYAALNQATGGETILLSAGDYGDIELIPWKTNGVDAVYDTPVTITSADPENRATFSDVDMRNVKNITFDNVIFDSTYSGASVWAAPFSVEDSEGVTFRNSLFIGELAAGTGDPTIDGYATGKGLTFSRSSNIQVEGNEFSTWHRGATFSEVTGLSVLDNELHAIRSDGLNFTTVTNAQIEGNYLHDFVASTTSGDHRDMIQFWTTNTNSPSENITIRGNILDAGDGSTTQSIFMRNEMVDQGLAGAEMFYRNILIEENLILNRFSHGITVGETDGLTIQNNSVLAVPGAEGDYSTVPRIKLASESTNVTVVQNAAYEINGYTGQSDWQLQDNAFVQNLNPNDPGYYGDQFFISSMGGAVTDYVVLPDSTIAQLGAGATSLLYDATPGSLTPLFQVHTRADDSGGYVFDASQSAGVGGLIDPATANFEWNFGDGSVATGQLVSHEFASPGVFDVSLTITQPDGGGATVGTEVGVLGDQVLSFNSADGQFYTHAYGEDISVDGTGTASSAFETGQAIDLGGDGNKVSIEHEMFSRYFGSEEFTISLTLQADQPGQSWGEVFRSHVNLLLLVNEDGEAEFTFTSENGDVSLVSTGLTVNDGEAHNIVIRFDGADNLLSLDIDGVTAASAPVDGVARFDNPRDLLFGNPWGDQNFDGKLTGFTLDVGHNDYPVFEGDLAQVSGSAVDGTVYEEVSSPSEPPVGTSDGTGEAAPGTSPNNLPAPADDNIEIDEDASIIFSPLGNDSDPDGDSLAITAVGAAANGTAVLNSDGTVTYTPNADFNGADSFSYTVSDGQGGSASATAAITVNPVNDAPAPADDIVTTDEDAAITFDPLENDDDIDGDTLVVTAVGAPSNGTAVLNADGTVTYTPNQDFNGADSFSYTVSDGQGSTKAATAWMTVDPVAEEPAPVDAGDTSGPGPIADNTTDSPSAPPPEPEGYVLDIAALEDGTGGQLYDDAHVIGTPEGGHAIALDGHNDRVVLNGPESYNAAEQLTVEVDFELDPGRSGGKDFVFSGPRMGVYIQDGHLGVYVNSSDGSGSFEKKTLNNTFVDDAVAHEVTLIADDTADRFQVVFDEEVVFDTAMPTRSKGRDFMSDDWTLGDGGPRQWGEFDGVISDFHVDDTAFFVEDETFVGV